MKVNEALKKYSLIPKRYEQNQSVRIIDTNLGKYVYKETKANNDILDYLKTRAFNYIPKIINDPFDDYQILEYIEDYDIPKEQKILDMILIVSLLHSKTTHYKEIDIGDYEKIYDDLSGNIEYLNGYYTDLISLIETKVYQSPSEYLLARNINVIFIAIKEAEKRLTNWYELISQKRKNRQVVLHNNLNLDHFIRNKRSYLISWDKAKIGNPVFDIYKLYKYHVLDFDFSDILKEYENIYPMQEDEKELFYTLILLPSVIEFKSSEYNMCITISREIDSIYKTLDFTKKT